MVSRPAIGKPWHSLLRCKCSMISELWYDNVVPKGGTCKLCHQQHDVEEQEKMQAWHDQWIGNDVQTNGQWMCAWLAFKNHWEDLLLMRHGVAWQEEKGGGKEEGPEGGQKCLA